VALSRTTVGLFDSGSNFGTGPFTTSSFTPPDDSLLVVAVAAMEEAGTTDPSADLTLSGGGWTWTPEDDAFDIGAWSMAVKIFTAEVTTGASMTLTADCGARDIYRHRISAVAYTGYDTTNPVGATGHLDSGPSDGAVTFELGAPPADDSEVFAAFGIDTGTGVTPGTDWTEVHDTGVDADGTGIQTQVRLAQLEPSAITFVASALGGTTTTTSFTITTPGTVQEGDLMNLEFTHRGTGDGTVSDNSGDGVSWTRKGEALFQAGARTTQHYYKRVTAAMAGGGDLITVTGLTNSSAGVLTVYRGAEATGDPFRDWTAEENASGDESHASVTTQADDWAVLVVGNAPDLAVTPTAPLVERAERLSTGGQDTSVMHASFEDTGGGGSGTLAWTQTDAASGSIGYSIMPEVSADNDATVSWVDVGVGGAVALACYVAVEVRASAGVFDLVVADVSQAQSVGSPALTQEHNLTPANVAQAQTVQNVALGVDLTVQDVAQTQTVESPTLTVAVTLDVDDVAQAQAVGSPTLAQDHQLAVQDVAQAQTAQSPALVQQHQLAVDGVVQAQTVQSLALTQVHVLDPADVAQAQTVESPTLDTELTLNIADVVQAQAVEAPALVQDHQLQVDSVAQAQSTSSPALAQDHQLQVQDVVQTQTVEDVNLSSEVTLVVQDVAQAQAVETPTLTQTYELQVDDVSQAQQVTDAGVLPQVHQLQVANVAQAQLIDNVTLIDLTQETPPERTWVIPPRRYVWVIPAQDREVEVP
jgi:hypothetical protein